MSSIWIRIILIATFITGTGIGSTSASAQAVCGKRDSLLAQLNKKYQEVPIAVALAANGAVIEITRAATGKWTMLLTDAKGMTCLMAVGEAGCASVHGANRLGSNSLIDLVVFGRAAAIRAGETVDRKAPNPTLNQASVDACFDRFDGLRHAKGSVGAPELRLEMQQAMHLPR